MTGGNLALKLRSLPMGTKKNSHKCIKMTVTNWKTILPAKFFRKYNARSTIIEMNCNNIITRKLIGILFSSTYEATPPSPWDAYIQLWWGWNTKENYLEKILHIPRRQRIQKATRRNWWNHTEKCTRKRRPSHGSLASLASWRTSYTMNSIFWYYTKLRT